MLSEVLMKANPLFRKEQAFSAIWRRVNRGASRLLQGALILSGQILVIAALSPTVQANDLSCLSRIIYREAGGKSVEAVAITARATINRSKKQHTTACGLIRKGTVKAKPVPTALLPYFKAIARAALYSKQDIAKGADSWNTGHKPRYKGAVKRQAGGQVYYAMRNH
jgi:hypothetical protein